MLFLAVFTLLTLSAVAVDPYDPDYSFVAPFGSGGGTSYSLSGEERITAIRVWERYSSYICGLQLRFGVIWSPFIGRKENTVKEMELFDGETIIQISGKYTSYVQSLIFTTNMGRSLSAGQPAGHSFNMYPENKRSELRIISGRYSSYITSIGSHWAIFYPSSNSTMP